MLCVIDIYSISEDYSFENGLKRKVEGVSFIVTRGGRILVERRSGLKRNDPGIVAIPGGHVEEGEGLVEACRRELLEELGLRCDSFSYIYTAPHSTPHEDQTVHYFLCENWEGTPVSFEAEEIFWIGFDEVDRLGFEIDREAVRKLSGYLVERDSDAISRRRGCRGP